MATQIVPVVGRAYDLNPHNSATCHATMAADLPYSRPVRVVGLSGDEAPADPWSAIAAQVKQSGGQIAQAEVNKQLAKYAPQAPQVTYFNQATAVAAKIPWLWVGIGAAVLLGGLIYLRSKKKAA